MLSKLIKFLLINILFILSIGCGDNSNNIDNTIPPISFSVQISLQSYPNLQTTGTAVYFSSHQGTNLGYRSHGIYVIKTSHSQYRSFDASCTYDPNTSSHIGLSGTGYKCPTCNSQFELFSGSIIKGPAQHSLREYNTHFSSGTIRIYN